MTTDDRTAAELRAEAERLAALADEREGQLTRADIQTMTPQQINEARAQGRLDNLLNGRNDQ